MTATTATSTDFVNPANGKVIDGVSSTYAWVAANSVMVPLTAASADFTGFNNAKTIDGTLATPGIGTLDTSDPILRYVDLSTVHVSQAVKQ